ncbi:helix-turn-helix transcriptional regulator [Amycolatopsis pithecellobii]|uniref:Helix-turn-helix domain-containing protein n=1 Tax=Amycolatopsis pithecellobii TaxID=664692 RepID=A0A6N7Z444_9PSEU|nr:helix-turn-helix domain-containing protein [Amycolatopsis pithecellobii]MTD53886.1 helix-turn-helix domain-containing protein [Amycolatopsis pithecellobii]
MTKKLLSIEDLSDFLGVPKGTLYQWRTKGYGPAAVRVGKYVRYRPEDVDTWLDGQEAA